jgi:hypothetical protein
VIFGFLIMGGAAALVTSFYPDSTRVLRSDNRRSVRANAATAVIAAIGIGFLVRFAQGWLWDRFHASGLVSAGSPEILVSAAPAVAALASAVRSVLIYGALLALAALIAGKLRRRWMLIPLAFAGACVLLPSGIHTPSEFALYYVRAVITVGLAALFCFAFARKNYLAYVLVLWMIALSGPIAQLFGNPNPAYLKNGWILAAVALVAIVWALVPVRGGSTGSRAVA